jgi:hypothetical protein
VFADCVNKINLEFSLEGALHRFRDALAAEADLYEKGGTR